jgi:hypothetical protein
MSLNKACQAREYNLLLEKSSKYFRSMPQMLDMILIQEWSGDIAQDIYRIIYAFKGRYCYKSDNDFVAITHNQIKDRIPKKSIETIKRGIRTLEKAGWIEIIQRGSKHLPNKIRLTMPEHLVERLSIEIYENTTLSPALKKIDYNSAIETNKNIACNELQPSSTHLCTNTEAAISNPEASGTIVSSMHASNDICEEDEIIITEQDLKLLQRHNDLFVQYKQQGLSIIECAKKVAAEFTSEEIEIISQTETNLIEKKQKCRPTRSNLPSESIKYAPPKNNNKNNLVKLTNTNFVKQESILSRNDSLHITKVIHNMKALGNIRGDSAFKKVDELIEEVKFHVSRYGDSNCFLKALNGATKLLRLGKWTTPIALKYSRLTAAKLRENKALDEKQRYSPDANSVIENLSNILTMECR